MAMEEKVTAEWISPDRADDAGSADLMGFFAIGGLALLAAAIMAMSFGMHFLPGHI